MTINLHLPPQTDTLKPKITVIGVGGAGGNAVNNMIAANLEGVDFVMANTDAQALETAMTDRTVQLGVTVTRGLGAGANPEIGGAAAEEALDEIADHISGSHMVFITAGMGGGTGTGAAPVIARMAREQGILTVGVITKPFQFEGTHRMRIAERGIEELQEYVDTLIVIPNQNLFRVANEKTTFADAFRMADEVLHSGVRGVTDLMVKPGLVNLDFADIRAVMSEMGKAMMGTGEAEGEKRAIDAAESAISNPLLDDVSLKGAHAVLINITGGPDMTLFEVDEAANRIRDEVDQDANIIFGSTFSDALEGRMRVSVVATGIDSAEQSDLINDKNLRTQAFTRPIETRPTNTNRTIVTQQEPKRERTAQEIVRQSGTMSAIEIVKAANETMRGQPMDEPMPAPEFYQPAQPAQPQPAPQPQPVQQQQYQRLEPQGHGSMDEPDEQLRKPFRLGEVKEQVGGGGAVFVPPRAEQPSQRTHMLSQSDELIDTGSNYEEEEPEHQSGGGSFNFFQKIAGVGKALSSKPEEEAPMNPREAMMSSGASRAAVQESPMQSPDEDEEYLDIPAFLRRQAN